MTYGTGDPGAILAIVFVVAVIITFVLTGFGIMDLTPEMVSIATLMMGYLFGRTVSVPTRSELEIVSQVR
ncbi:hypothetical protein CV102_17225 [Natronococcus pandeyae]|uniref:Uncharacterized protein n=1 Tax=Natronococcus pandeyae TaxID=2055836 RepID=A0A8J8Q2K9_9EURY|nr:hypothetical protein CV102_17225 [Natronococcus pandeyae]